MSDFPPGPPEGTGVVIITLSTGLEIEAEWDGVHWWSHLNDNPQAAPLDSFYVTSWRYLEPPISEEIIPPVSEEIIPPV